MSFVFNKPNAKSQVYEFYFFNNKKPGMLFGPIS